MITELNQNHQSPKHLYIRIEYSQHSQWKPMHKLDKKLQSFILISQSDMPKNWKQTEKHHIFKGLNYFSHSLKRKRKNTPKDRKDKNLSNGREHMKVSEAISATSLWSSEYQNLKHLPLILVSWGTRERKKVRVQRRYLCRAQYTRETKIHQKITLWIKVTKITILSVLLVLKVENFFDFWPWPYIKEQHSQPPSNWHMPQNPNKRFILKPSSISISMYKDWSFLLW